MAAAANTESGRAAAEAKEKKEKAEADAEKKRQEAEAEAEAKREKERAEQAEAAERRAEFEARAREADAEADKLLAAAAAARSETENEIRQRRISAETEAASSGSVQSPTKSWPKPVIRDGEVVGDRRTSTRRPKGRKLSWDLDEKDEVKTFVAPTAYYSESGSESEDDGVRVDGSGGDDEQDEGVLSTLTHSSLSPQHKKKRPTMANLTLPDNIKKMEVTERDDDALPLDDPAATWSSMSETESSGSGWGSGGGGSMMF